MRAISRGPPAAVAAWQLLLAPAGAVLFRYPDVGTPGTENSDVTLHRHQ